MLSRGLTPAAVTFTNTCLSVILGLAISVMFSVILFFVISSVLCGFHVISLFFFYMILYLYLIQVYVISSKN